MDTRDFVRFAYPTSDRHDIINFDRSDEETKEFEGALFRMGEYIVGQAHNYDKCMDVDFPRKHTLYFTPAFEPEIAIKFAKNKTRWHAYMQKQPQEAREAIQAIVDELKRVENSRHFSGTRPQRSLCALDEGAAEPMRVHQRVDYDIDVLKENYLKLWSARPELDQRLDAALLLFHNTDKSAFDNVKGLTLQDEAKALLTASLLWMQQPENASKIARRFLFVRMAQQFSTLDPRSKVFAEKVADAIDGNKEAEVWMGINLAPSAYYALKAGGLPRQRARMEKDSLPLIGMSRKHGAGVRAELARVIEDYKALRDGTWATMQLGMEYMPKRVVKKIAPVAIEHAVA